MTRLGTSLVAVTALLALGACGTTETAASTPTGVPTGGSVTVTDSRGKAMQLKAPAQKVVGLEWGEVEMLVTLGVMPVGVADVKGYGTWVTAAKLDGSVKDVGTRGEPSVDSIVALQPDLVVMEAERDSALVAQIEKYVPVIVTKGSDAANNLGRMRDDFNLIAAATGRTERAKQVLTEFDAAVAGAKAKIAAKGNAGKGFAVADGWIQGSAVSIRMFGQGALVSQIGLQVGLTNAWTGKVDEVWGLGTTDVEGLTPLKTADVHFFYNASDGDDVFATGLAKNAIWTSLPFVRDGKLHKQPNGIWTFGGPLSCQQFLDQLIKVYGA